MLGKMSVFATSNFSGIGFSYRLVRYIEDSLPMNSSVKQIFDSYPAEVKEKMIDLRKLILSVADTLETNNSLEETLKWGEPSFLIKGGSTVRIDWKESNPECLGIYFNCQTKLIDTFREIFDEKLRFEGNRAILLDINTPLPEGIISQCVKAAFTYHKRKKLPLLGI